jgi:hypothetical protein
MDYSTLKDTWTKKSSLHTSSFDPFKNLNELKENYYVNQASTYTTYANVTPSNTISLPIKYYKVNNGLIQVDNSWKNSNFCK